MKPNVKKLVWRRMHDGWHWLSSCPSTCHRLAMRNMPLACQSNCRQSIYRVPLVYSGLASPASRQWSDTTSRQICDTKAVAWFTKIAKS